MADFYFIWKKDGVEVCGPNINTGWRSPISFSGEMTDAVAFTLNTSAQANQTYETVTGLRFYLSGDPDDVATVLQWTTMQPSGGVEISFDSGRSWSRFSPTVGNIEDPSTWITLPASSVGIQGIDGQLGPFDVANVMTRFNIPLQNTVSKVFNLSLGIDCDVL